MILFLLTPDPIDIPQFQALLADPECGALVGFEGRVRSHHEGRQVLSLEYEAYADLAVAEGNRILDSVRWKYGLRQILCVHRTGTLRIGDASIWIGALSEHRQEAFEGVNRAMHEIKSTVPIWKRVHYVGGGGAWLLCHEPAHFPAIAKSSG